jgi:hypothetical protein
MQARAKAAEATREKILDAAEAVSVDHYDRFGDRILRLIGAEDRNPAFLTITDLGRLYHREWCEGVFAAALIGQARAPRGPVRRRHRRLRLEAAAPRSRPQQRAGHARHSRAARASDGAEELSCESLASTPVHCLCAVPFGRDQFEVARRVEAARAGTQLFPWRLNPDRLRTKVREAIAMRPGAERVAESFAATDGAKAAADAFERLQG